MRFRIPPQHRETVTIVRQSAYERREETTVAEDITCMIQPVSPGAAATEFRENIAIEEDEKIALLSKPDTHIKKGDFLVRDDTDRFRIHDITGLKGSPIMYLHLTKRGVL